MNKITLRRKANERSELRVIGMDSQMCSTMNAFLNVSSPSLALFDPVYLNLKAECERWERERKGVDKTGPSHPAS